MTPTEINAALFEILQMRRVPDYHAAEVMRRERGEVSMAESPPGSTPYANIRLLIGTWETIATRVRPNSDLKIPFYEVDPVGHMWQALEPAIKIIRKEKVSIMRNGRMRTITLGRWYARQFQLLNTEYMAWLDTKPVDYQSAALGGINAQFG